MSVHYVPAKRPPTPDIMGAMLEAKVAPEQIELESIQTNGGTQMRAGLNAETVGEYMQTLRDSDQAWPFPPVTVYYDGENYWLGDGFHRVAAARQTGRTGSIPAEIRAGTRRDAVLYAAGANANHGLRRTNADKRQAVETLLRDEEWAKWSDSEIARRCAVDHKTVSNVRSILGISQDAPTERTVTRGSQTYTQNTANIGSNQPAYAPIWKLERVVSETAFRYYASYETRYACDDMRACAKTRDGGGFWRACERAMPPDIGEWRRGDLAQAINNVAAQIEAPAPTPAKLQPAAWPGFSAHTWDGYSDWDDDDQAEYEALAPTWRLPRTEFNDLVENKKITRWRVAARLGSERPDNLAWSLQDIARRLRLRERSSPAADDAWRADIAERQAAAEEAERQAQAASVPNVPQTGMNQLFVKGSLRRWLGDRYAAQDDPALHMYQMLDHWLKGAWLYDLEAFTATLPAGWTQDALDQAIQELHAHFAPDEDDAPAEPVISLDELEMVSSVTGPTGWTDPAPEHELDSYDEESPTVAARRMNKLHTLKVRFAETIDLLDDFGELTGRHTATLAVGRELAHLIDLLDAEMDALGGA